MFGRWRPQWSSIYIHSALLALCENLLSPIPHVHYCSGFCAPHSVVRLFVRFSPIQCILSPWTGLGDGDSWAIQRSDCASRQAHLGVQYRWGWSDSDQQSLQVKGPWSGAPLMLRCPQCVSSDDIMSELRLDFEWISGSDDEPWSSWEPHIVSRNNYTSSIIKQQSTVTWPPPVFMWRHADVWQPSWQQRQYGQCCWGVNVWGVNWLLVHYVCCQSHHFWSSEMEETRNSTGKDGIGAWMCSNPSNNYYIWPIQHGWTLFCWVSLEICTTIQAVQWSTSGLSFAPTGRNALRTMLGSQR